MIFKISLKPNNNIRFVFENVDYAYMKKRATLQNGIFLYFLHLMCNNPSYADYFLNYHNVKVLKIHVTDNIQVPIDYKSCDIVTRKLWAQIELEDALHWLSTLGGAYSNLGDHSLDFAMKAGENAFKQMKIALRSEDPAVLYKCWLFVAMSKMQQKRLKDSKMIIKNVYDNVKLHNADKNLISMCKGIWARLQYAWVQQLKKSDL